MKRWVIVTDKVMELAAFKGQFQAAQLPTPDRYDLGDWVEAVVSEDAPRVVWRVLCADVPVDD